MWYLYDDGTIIMNTQVHLQKAKNIRRDPRIAICIEDGPRYVSINGTVNIIEDQEIVRHDIECLVARYIKGEETRQQYIATFVQQQRVALHLRSEKVIEYFAV
jgi:PPOX class probable F420-dependent enzyme